MLPRQSLNCEVKAGGAFMYRRGSRRHLWSKVFGRTPSPRRLGRAASASPAMPVQGGQPPNKKKSGKSGKSGRYKPGARKGKQVEGRISKAAATKLRDELAAAQEEAARLKRSLVVEQQRAEALERRQQWLQDRHDTLESELLQERNTRLDHEATIEELVGRNRAARRSLRSA